MRYPVLTGIHLPSKAALSESVVVVARPEGVALCRFIGRTRQLDQAHFDFLNA